MSSVIGTASWRSDFTYDGLGRARKRQDYTWYGGNPPGWIGQGTTYYVYDGMRVIQERASSPTVSYTRGSDLSGSFEGAGGIGGLLARSHAYQSGSGSWTNHNYYHSDGGGNVTYMVDTNQNMVATYRYDPFGNTISSSGTLASANVYRFSSKERHANSGMYYYGYRFYDPNVQRWPNRDPLGEAGGINLYDFVRNNPVIYFDHFGLQARKPRIGEPGYVTPIPTLPPDWHPGKGPPPDGRATIVCDGKGGIRIHYPKSFDPKKIDPCVFECLDKHELCHKQEALASNPNVCAGQPDGTWVLAPEGVVNRSEVRCSQVELDCLKERKGDCSCSDSAINSRIPQVEAYRDNYKKLLGN